MPSKLGTVVPGFEFDDYEAGVREELVGKWPGWREWREWIVGLTRG